MSATPSECPFIPIAKPLLGEEEKAAVMAVLGSGMLAQGQSVAEFEACFAELCSVRHAVAVALNLSLRDSPHSPIVPRFKAAIAASPAAAVRCVF